MKHQLDLSKRSNAVQSLVKKTIDYLQRLASEDPKAQIRPATLALAIGVNEMLALTALDMLQNAGVTKAHIGLYCAETLQRLGQVERGRPTPEALPCDACLREIHDFGTGTMRKEIFFTFDPEALAELKEAA